MFTFNSVLSPICYFCVIPKSCFPSSFFLLPTLCYFSASQSKPVTIVGDKSENLAGDASAESNSKVEVVKPPKKIVGINKPQICKNKGCGQTFKEKDNHDTACSYHPGPAVFHDRMRGVGIIYSTEYSCIFCSCDMAVTSAFHLSYYFAVEVLWYSCKRIWRVYEHSSMHKGMA